MHTAYAPISAPIYYDPRTFFATLAIRLAIFLVVFILLKYLSYKLKLKEVGLSFTKALLMGFISISIFVLGLFFYAYLIVLFDINGLGIPMFAALILCSILSSHFEVRFCRKYCNIYVSFWYLVLTNLLSIIATFYLSTILASYVYVRIYPSADTSLYF